VKLIVGLGNPGVEYERTRHNAGFMAVDRLARRHAPGAVARGRFNAATLEARISNEPCLLIKPTTFMNRSGFSVAEAVRFYKLDPVADLLVMVDDVALPAGAIRVRASGGAGGHNGLADIERMVGGPSYARCRIGIDPPGRAPQRDYVLGRFSPEQWERMEPALEKAADAAEVWVAEGAISAMNRFNAPPAPDEKERGDGEARESGEGTVNTTNRPGTTRGEND